MDVLPTNGNYGCFYLYYPKSIHQTSTVCDVDFFSSSSLVIKTTTTILLIVSDNDFVPLFVSSLGRPQALSESA